ncbi:ABC transporter ATP-binding protein [Aromatoleum aromaticum]|uniref:ABC transporter ATP-binding protein n=1 Tax=Aromatoleum aromaticum TaxID=551760 RepID=UPI001459D4F7|nr:ABC transporter ATP-binding protein [Aromatoleum aromaticum]NMG53937.1 ATP-binding cassette domain-containing protein [Aromatoleum aromaticum]
MSAEALRVAGATPTSGLTAQGERERLSALYRWLWKFIRPELPAFAAVLLLSLLAVAAGLGQPYLTKALIDDGILARDRAGVLEIGALMVGLALTALAIGFGCRRIHVAASARMLHRMRESLFAHVLSLSPMFFSRTRQGDLLARLEGDLGEVQRFAVDAVLSAINSTLTLIGTVALLGLLSPRLALFLAVLIAVNSVVLSWVKPRIEGLSLRARDAGVDVSSFLVEKLAAVRCIQTHMAEARELERLQGLHDEVRGRMLALQVFGYFGGAFPNLVLSLAVIGIFVGGSLAMIGGDALTLGTLVAFATYVQRASAPLHGLMGLYLQWQRVKVGLGRVEEIRCLRPAVAAMSGNAEKLPAGELVVRDLVFSYPDSQREVLSGLNFTIPAGAKVWFRGASGSGKSTFIDLLHRHFDPESGSISIGGIDLCDVDISVLRRHVVVVAQEPVLFAGSIAENIRYACPDATQEDMERVALAAGVLDFVRRLPDGLDAQVGARGAALSGGEKQRVALARALLLKPAVLVIDEGTSSLDADLEQRFLHASGALLPGAMRIVVSHRELACDAFDLVIDFQTVGSC